MTSESEYKENWRARGEDAAAGGGTGISGMNLERSGYLTTRRWSAGNEVVGRVRSAAMSKTEARTRRVQKRFMVGRYGAEKNGNQLLHGTRQKL